MEEMSKERQEQVAMGARRFGKSLVQKMFNKMSETGSASLTKGGEVISDEGHYEKRERVRIPRKGEYGRRLRVINTPDGPREYHITKGWRS